MHDYVFVPTVPLGGPGNILMEPDNISVAHKYNAGVGGAFPYKYMRSPSGTPRKCAVGSTSPGKDMPGADLRNFVVSTPAECGAACCADFQANGTCMGYVYAVAPAEYGGCKKGDKCCYLKNAKVAPVDSTVPGIIAGSVKTAGGDNLESPPSGIRSAVPLGGISTGAVELRGDGSLHEWTIQNQNPGGQAKIQEYPEALFAARIAKYEGARVLQTSPKIDAQGVESIQYSGIYPVSRLTFADAMEGLSLYAFSAYKVGDQAASCRPAVAFVLESPDEETDFMFQLPVNLETDQIRKGTPLPASSQPLPNSVASSAECLQSCQANADCQSWMFDRTAATCTLQSDAADNVYKLGVDSGLRFSWAVDQDAGCLNLVRPGTAPASGGIALCLASDEPLSAWSAGTSDNRNDLYARFAANGSVAGASMTGAFGAVSVSGTKSLVITMGWFFPFKDHFGQVVGNQYSVHYSSAQDAAWGSVPIDQRAAALASVVDDLWSVQEPFVGAETSIPSWLGDQLVNSLSHIRTAMWFKNCSGCHRSQDPRITGTGFWRQWESYGCDDLDSIHNDGERHIPYIMFFPNTTRSKLAAWAGNQGPNGMLAEQILNKAPDTPQGRVMCDSSSMFMVYLLELLNWDGDMTSLKLYWPTVQKIAAWHISTTDKLGVPYKLETTYDQLQFPQKYDVSSYATAFHLLAMRVCVDLAAAMGDNATQTLCAASLSNVTAAFDLMQWNKDHYSAGASGCAKGQGCSSQIGVFADSFYAQVLAYTNGLGPLVDTTKLAAHMNTTAVENCAFPDGSGGLIAGKCPNGLLTLTGRGGFGTDYELWQMINHDFAAIQLNLGNDADDSLDFSKRSALSWSEGVNDQWGTAALSDANGFPTCINHYGYHMTSWHIPLALSGQKARLYPAESASLTFTIRLSADEKTDNWSLPVLLPGRLGTIQRVGENYMLSLNFGTLTVKTLSVDGCAAPAAITVSNGQPASWPVCK